jgi:hypothetical protein
MYDPKFEKEIQRKMEELEFRPAESVWVNIEKAVVDKRRRRTGMMWRYLAPGIFLVAAAGLYMHYAHGKTTVTIAAGNIRTVQPAGGASAAPSTAAAATTASAATTVAAATDAAAGNTVSNGNRASRSGNKVHSENAARLGLAGGFITRNSRNNGSSGDAENATRGVARGLKAENGTAAGAETADESYDEMVASPATAGSTGAVAGQKRLPEWFYWPGLAGQRLSPHVQGAALTTKKSNLVAVAGLTHPQARWEAGFVGGGGWSRLNRLNVDQAKAALNSNATSLYTIANSSSSKQIVSQNRPDASFDGGIYLQRNLSDRWILNTGMNLHYYSNRISVGQQVTTYVQASASYLVPTTSLAARNNSVYSTGDTKTFTNKYYFLELPLGLQWKITKSHLLPIFLEGGISLSRLMGASALFYDAKTGLYSKNGDVVDKTQLNISSALLLGLPIHGIALQLGPVIQYGLTPLVNTQGLGDQHFLYTGIRLVVIPGRK